MKNISKKTILITLVVIFILALFVGMHEQKNIEIAKVKAELIEAKKPSLVEVIHNRITENEGKWRRKQQKIEKLETEKQETISEKLELEKQIQEDRKRLLGK